MNLHKNFFICRHNSLSAAASCQESWAVVTFINTTKQSFLFELSHQYCNIGQLKSTRQNPNLMRSSFPNCCITGNEENFPTKNRRTSQLWTFQLHLKPGNYLGVMEAIVALWMCHKMNVPQFRRYVPLL